MADDRNSTHTIIFKSENKGLRVVIGAIVLIVWLRWWWTGSLLAALASFVPAGYLPEGFNAAQPQFGSSITGTLLQLAADLSAGIGSIVVTVLSLGWRFIWDVISGIIEFAQSRRAQSEAEKAAVDQAVTAATSSAVVTAVAGEPIAASKAVVFAPFLPADGKASPVRGKRVDMAKVAAALQDHDDLLSSQIEADIAINKLVRDLERRTVNIEHWRDNWSARPVSLEMFTEAIQVHNDRIGKLESVTPADGQWYRELIERLTDLELRLASSQQNNAKVLGSLVSNENFAGFVDTINAKIDALEQSTIKKPAARKSTRQVPKPTKQASKSTK